MGYLKVIVIVITVLILTGCGKDKIIECAYYEQDDNLKTTYDYLLKLIQIKKI